MNRLAWALLSLSALTSCGPEPKVHVNDVWARDTIGRTANAAVFMTIRSDRRDRLVAASAPIATKVDLMTFEGGSGAMGMRYVDAIKIPAGQSVSLNPGGFHIWLADLKQPLRAGERVPMTLRFEKGGNVEVTAAIIDPAAPPPATKS